MAQLNIAFLGLGIMGTGMAGRLVRAGFPVTVFNRNPEKTKPLAAEGARMAGTPRAAAAGADLIISMVADDTAARALWLGEPGALAGASPGSVAMECSTNTVAWARELAAAAAARGLHFLDAPVTGSRLAAAGGELTFLVGGEAAVLERVRPALAVMGKAVVHLGPAGSGAMIKLINNFLCGVQVVGLAEALTMIEHSGLDRAKALEIITTGAPGSPMVKAVATRMATLDFTPNFHLQLMAKDLHYAIAQGGEFGVDLTMGKAALKRIEDGVAAGFGQLDMASVITPVRQNG